MPSLKDGIHFAIPTEPDGLLMPFSSLIGSFDVIPDSPFYFSGSAATETEAFSWMA
jgi:hypothetical protein